MIFHSLPSYPPWGDLNHCYLTGFSWMFQFVNFLKISEPALPAWTTVMLSIICGIYFNFSSCDLITVVHNCAGVWLYVRKCITFFHNTYLTFLMRTVCNLDTCGLRYFITPMLNFYFISILWYMRFFWY